MINRLLFIFAIFFFFFSCKEADNPVPAVYFSEVYRNIEADAQFNSVLSPNNAIVVSGGYNNNGVLIFRQKIEGAVDDFVAFDLTCTFEISNCAMQWENSDPWYLKCKCCGSRFNIIGQYMETGPAEHPLRSYQCQYLNGDLYVSN